MASLRCALRVVVLFVLARFASAQVTTTSVPSRSSYYPGYFSSSFPPEADATGSGNANRNDEYSGGLNTYYAVGLALLLCCVALALFFMFRRKAKEVAARRRRERLGPDASGSDGPNDLASAAPVRGQRRGWNGRLRSAEVSREEGLNEQGEGPPQYIPKSEWEQLQRNTEDGQAGGPDIPLQTLSRDAAGLKPPDYSESNAYEASAGNPTTTGSSSRPINNTTA